jgi:DNA primase catalytic subunit
MNSGNTLTVKPFLEAEAIRRFYQEWNEPKLYRGWDGLWRKQIKIESYDKRFIALNKKTSRLNHRKLKNYAIRLTPIHIYASVMEYLRPEKVLSKDRTLKAYPVGGEFCMVLMHI